MSLERNILLKQKNTFEIKYTFSFYRGHVCDRVRLVNLVVLMLLNTLHGYLYNNCISISKLAEDKGKCSFFILTGLFSH